jgi:hypothetical protein
MNQRIEEQPDARLYRVPALTWTAPTLWSVLWPWGLATAGGVILAYIPAIIGIMLMFSIRTESAAMILTMATAAAMATPIALFQRMILNKLNEIEGWWFRATVGGAAVSVGLLILDDSSSMRRILRLLLGNIYYHNSLIVFFGQIGLVIGICQWLVLRRTIPRASLWIAANLLAGLLVGWIGEMRGEEFILGIFQLLTYTLITGTTLRLLLGQRRFEAGRP